MASGEREAASGHGGRGRRWRRGRGRPRRGAVAAAGGGVGEREAEWGPPSKLLKFRMKTRPIGVALRTKKMSGPV